MANEKKLEDLTPEELGRLFPIHIVPYDKDWVRVFNSESKLLRDTLGDKIAIQIEHFGSTAVEGLAAKPTIDIIIEIPHLTDSLKELLKEKMSGIGYQYIWRTDEKVPYMHFVKGYTIDGLQDPVFHIHMGDKEHPLWDRIYFRDYLRKHHEVANEYAVLKMKLADTFKYDRDGYTKAKGDFVERITNIAKSEH